MREVDPEALKRLADADGPVLVDFVKQNCPWCDRQAPELERLAARWGKQLDMVRFDIGRDMDLAQDYAIRGTPTLVLLAGGKRLGSKSGFQRAQQIEAFLDYHLGPLGDF